jgi:hypothetical protein
MAAGVAVTMEAADIVNYNDFSPTGREVLIAHNTGVGANTVSVDSVSVHGRSGNIAAESIAADAIRVYGPFNTGWKQSDDKIHFEADSIEVEFGIIRW